VVTEEGVRRGGRASREWRGPPKGALPTAARSGVGRTRGIRLVTSSSLASGAGQLVGDCLSGLINDLLVVGLGVIQEGLFDNLEGLLVFSLA